MSHKRKSPAFSFYPDSWFLGTSNLSAAQEGIYIRLLCLQWSNGAFSVQQAFDHSKRSALETDIKAVLDAKFKLVDGLYLNERLENERSIQQSRVESAKKAGKKSGEARLKNKTQPQQNERQLNGTSNETATTTATKHPTKNEHSVSVSVSDSITDLGSDSHTPLPPKGDAECVAEDLEIPKSLGTPEFLKAWSSWIAFHKSAGKPLNPVTGHFQLEHLSRQGPTKAVKDLILTMSSAREPGKIWDSDRELVTSAAQKPKRRFED